MTTEPATLMELARVFLRLGATSFGGPAAHIAIMEEEIVKRRGWVTRERFLDLLGAANLIPGPNSSEVAMHLGWQRAGMPGMVVAGIAFIFPAVAITLALAWAYAAYGTLPLLTAPFAGIRAALIAVILGAVWRLGRSAIRSPTLAVIGVLVLAASLAGGNELFLLLAAGVLGASWTAGIPGFARGGTAGAVEPTLLALFLYFLKIGSILYGSGYVLIAFLEGGLVDRLHWLTRAQLLDAIAAGQFTPGPVLSAAAFVGYLIYGVPGALLSTLGIFLPSFVFVAITSPWVGRLRKTPWPAAFLDSVNVASLALMVAVAVKLIPEALTGVRAWVIAVASLLVLARWSLSPAWIVGAGALLGWLLL
ncbi:MAG TPA: chromate transporter [Gemmatimonadales bacterium]|nr:chromate transporter [Gemmatimonadales bacterium]